MKELEKKEINNFKSHYFSLNSKKRAQLRNIILEGCDFSLSTFYYKLTNENFKKLEIKRINEIVSENIKFLK